jgi:hypothetical protein
MKIKKNSTIDADVSSEQPSQQSESNSMQEVQSQIFDNDDWEIEYDE